MTDIRFAAELMQQQTLNVLISWGMPEDLAVQTAQLMIETDLLGVDSHGISMLPHYDRLLQAGQWCPQGRASELLNTPTTAVLDGGHSLGHPTAMQAMQTAVEKSEQYGLGCVVVRNGNHFGAAGLYARHAARQGKLALVTSTTRSRMLVPTGAAAPVLGTNPIAFAAPAGHNADFVLDMATTTVAANKVKVYQFHQQELPAGWVVDGSGESVTDSALGLAQVFQSPDGGLTPLGGLLSGGGHKGYGLAMMVQILAGALAGSAFPATRPKDALPDIGHFFLAIDPKAFGVADSFGAALDEMIDTLHNTPASIAGKSVMVAGEPEDRHHADRLMHGIPLATTLLAQLEAICQRQNVPFLLHSTKAKYQP